MRDEREQRKESMTRKKCGLNDPHSGPNECMFYQL
jgi:hypothetical protein